MENLFPLKSSYKIYTVSCLSFLIVKIPGLLPLAGQRRDAALAAYRAGSGGSLTAVLEARRAEIDTQAERLRIELDIARLWAQLNYLMPPDDASAPPATARSPQ